MNIANFTFVPGLDRRLPTTILHRWVSLQSWKTTAEVALVCPSCRTFQKKYGISWTKRGVAETYCTMYGHGMYDPAKHEEHCWPVATVWQWVGSVGSSYVWRWGCCFFHLGSEAFDPAWRIEDFTCSTNYGSPMWFSKKCQVICKKFPRLHGWSHCVREPKFTAALATNRIQVSVNLRWKGSGCGAGMVHGFKHLMWTWLKHPDACEKSKMGKRGPVLIR